tara:strand:- start:188 stop:322 length:135 start_codon:yes stop_codon:yes gene_type:complete
MYQIYVIKEGKPYLKATVSTSDQVDVILDFYAMLPHLTVEVIEI